jgi:hypothetical protein
MRNFIVAFCTASVAVVSLSSACADNKDKWPPDIGIVFSFQEFVDTRGTVSIKGALIADWLGYKNNEHSIVCFKDGCWVASVEQIGPNQIGPIDGPIYYDVARWSEKEIVATSDDLCERVTITIDREAKTTLFTWIPINQSTEFCKIASHDPRSATIGQSKIWDEIMSSRKQKSP